MRVLVALLIASANPGCIGEAEPAEEQQPSKSGWTVSGTPTGETRGNDEFWFVWVEGRESSTPPPNHSCSIAFDHRVDEHDQTIHYTTRDPPGYNFDAPPTRMIAFDVYKANSCVANYELFTGTEWLDSIGLYGNVGLYWDGGNLIQPTDASLRPGQTASFEATIQDDGIEKSIQFTVRNMGPWPLAGLLPEG